MSFFKSWNKLNSTHLENENIIFKEHVLNRIQSVDTFRLIAIFAVISLHTTPFMTESLAKNEFFEYLPVLLNQLARFAVPFFFIISGYFFSLKIKNGADPLSTAYKMGYRIFILFLFWCFIYLLPYNLSAIYEYGILGPIKVSYWNIKHLINYPITLVMQGTKIHLWFMISLLFSLYICSFFIHKRWIKSLAIISILLYITGVLAKAYIDTPIGLHIGFNTRNGPFFGTLFFTTGYLISKLKSNPRWLLYGSFIFIIGCAIHFFEIYIINKYFGTSLYQDYVFGTYFMGLGVAMASLSNHPILQCIKMSNVGQMTLGIYAIHFIFVDLFNTFDTYLNSAVWEIGYVSIVTILSIQATLFLSKNIKIKKFIM